MQPFELEVIDGRYWLTRLKSRAMTAAMREFREWVMGEIATPAGGP